MSQDHHTVQARAAQGQTSPSGRPVPAPALQRPPRRVPAPAYRRPGGRIAAVKFRPWPFPVAWPWPPARDSGRADRVTASTSELSDDAPTMRCWPSSGR